jgi:hypothetical protein
MRRIISILFTCLLLLQGIPVLHFFSSQPEVFYAYIDEDKPTEKKEVKDGKEVMECLSTHDYSLHQLTVSSSYIHSNEPLHLAPCLEAQSPPPDFC